MKNFILNDKMINNALDHKKWKIVSSILPISQLPVKNDEHMSWVKENLHSHSQREILFSFSGKTFYSFNNECYECNSASVFVFDPFVQHARGYRETNNELVHLWLIFAQDKILAHLHHIGQEGNESKRFYLNSLEAELLSEIWNKLKVNQPMFSDELRKARFIFALSNVILQVIELFLKNEQNDYPEHQKMIMEAITKHIDETYGKNETVDNLSRIAGYSKFHFMRLFKEYTGQTVLEYINNCRIRKTKEMLRELHSKKNIGYSLGFSSAPAFSSWFKKNF